MNDVIPSPIFFLFESEMYAFADDLDCHVEYGYNFKPQFIAGLGSVEGTRHISQKEMQVTSQGIVYKEEPTVRDILIGSPVKFYNRNYRAVDQTVYFTSPVDTHLARCLLASYKWRFGHREKDLEILLDDIGLIKQILLNKIELRGVPKNNEHQERIEVLIAELDSVVGQSIGLKLLETRAQSIRS